MSAMTNTHWKVRHKPRSSVRERTSKVDMLEPLTAWRGEVPWLTERSVLEGGTMLTSAPVSTRNRRELMWSFM